ncbi:MAG: hypothetical protein ACI4MC_02580, partial [Candidatus Coproplasma sp.]
ATVTDAQDTDGEVTEEQKKILDKYALFATGILGEGKITSSCTAADKVGYEFKLGIGYTDVFGSSVETVLYFNKVEGTVKVDKDEEKFAIVGELVKGNLSFPVEGKYKTETDDDETENEIEFTAFTSSDCRSFIKMEYKYEAEEDETESKVVISVYENGKCTEEAKIKGETGEDSSFTVEVMRHDGGEDVEIKFNPYEENGTKIMQVDAWFGENKHELIMQNKSWEQGGGFDFINRSNGNEQGDTEGDKDDKDEPVIPSPEYPDYEWDKDDEQDWEYDYDYPFAPPYGLGL